MKIYIRKYDDKSERFEDVTEIKETSDSISIKRLGKDRPKTYPRDEVREIVLHGLVTA